MRLEWHTRHHGGAELPALAWRPAAPVRVAATSVLGGGIGDRAWFLNATVPADYPATDPEGDLADLASAMGLTGDGVGMLTAKDVRSAVQVDDDGVRVLATVGLGWPTWAAAPAEEGGGGAQAAGTVNVLVVVPAALGDAALVNAVATATEAKVQALLEAGVDGTGTASDAVCVAADGSGPPERYGGPRSRWGAPLARAVHRAVLLGAG